MHSRLLIMGLVLLLSSVCCRPVIDPGGTVTYSGTSLVTVRPRIRALLIGADYVPKGMQESEVYLKFRSDAKLIEHWISGLDGCAEIRVHSGAVASKKEIMNQLDWLGWKDVHADSDKERPKISVFYFSGHGNISATNSSLGFIIPTDGLKTQLDTDKINQNELFTKMKNVDPANSIQYLVLLDSCNSGIFASYLQEHHDKFSNFQLISASNAGQPAGQSEDNSIFTQALYSSLSRLSLDATIDEIVLSTRALIHNDENWQKYKQEPAFYPTAASPSADRFPFLSLKKVKRQDCRRPVAAIRTVEGTSQINNLNITIEASGNCNELSPETEVARFMNREDDDLAAFSNTSKFRLSTVPKFKIIGKLQSDPLQCRLNVQAIPPVPNAISPSLISGDLLVKTKAPKQITAIKIYISKECRDYESSLDCPLCSLTKDRDSAEYALEFISLNPTAPGDHPGGHPTDSGGTRSSNKACGWRRVQTSEENLLLPDAIRSSGSAVAPAAGDLAKDIERIYNMKYWQVPSSPIATLMPEFSSWSSDFEHFPYHVVLQPIVNSGPAPQVSKATGDRLKEIRVQAGTEYQLLLKQQTCAPVSCRKRLQRYVYICQFDSRTGQARLLFPNNVTTPSMQALAPNLEQACRASTETTNEDKTVTICEAPLVPKVTLSRQQKLLIVLQARNRPYTEPADACQLFHQEVSCDEGKPQIARRNGAVAAFFNLPALDLLDRFVIKAN